jgi:transcriptional regulator with XRE-family HTH domain
LKTNERSNLELRLARVQLGLSQEQLAQHTSALLPRGPTVLQCDVSQWELNGVRPHERIRKAVAQALDVDDPDQLFPVTEAVFKHEVGAFLNVHHRTFVKVAELLARDPDATEAERAELAALAVRLSRPSLVRAETPVMKSTAKRVLGELDRIVTKAAGTLDDASQEDACAAAVRTIHDSGLGAVRIPTFGAVKERQ